MAYTAPINRLPELAEDAQNELNSWASAVRSILSGFDETEVRLALFNYANYRSLDDYIALMQGRIDSVSNGTLPQNYPNVSAWAASISQPLQTKAGSISKFTGKELTKSTRIYADGNRVEATWSIKNDIVDDHQPAEIIEPTIEEAPPSEAELISSGDVTPSVESYVLNIVLAKDNGTFEYNNQIEPNGLLFGVLMVDGNTFQLSSSTTQIDKGSNVVISPIQNITDSSSFRKLKLTAYSRLRPDGQIEFKSVPSADLNLSFSMGRNTTWILWYDETVEFIPVTPTDDFVNTNPPIVPVTPTDDFVNTNPPIVPVTPTDDFVNATPPNLSSHFELDKYYTQAGEVARNVKLIVEHSYTSTIQLSGFNFEFNNGVPFSIEVEYSGDVTTSEIELPAALWGTGTGLRILNVVGTNQFTPVLYQGNVNTTFEEIGVFETDQPTQYITEFIVDRPIVYNKSYTYFSYLIKNVYDLATDTGVLDAVIYFENESGLYEVSREYATRKNRSVLIDIPTGTYNVFIEIDGRYVNGVDTRVYSNSVITVNEQTAETVVPVSREELSAVLAIALEMQTNLSPDFIDAINEKRVLRNLLVDDELLDEYLICSFAPVVDGSTVLKLYDTFSNNERTKNKFSIAYELIDPFVTTVTIEDDVVFQPGIELAGPNFDIDDPTDIGLPISDTNIVGSLYGSSVDYLRFDDVLNFKKDEEHSTILDVDLDGSSYIVSGSITTELLNKILGDRKVSDKDLNIDYSDYSNFVFYSSAKERLTNFRYKLQLMESYESTLNQINSGSATSSIAVRDEINRYNNNINDIKSTFDGYEHFMYYNTSSAASWPHTDGVVQSPTSSLGISYFTSQSAVADLYDVDNIYNLHKDLPEYILRDTDNSDFTLFVSMIGHHFDIVKAHVDAVNRMFVRTHSEYGGPPKKVIKKLLEAFGWQIRTLSNKKYLSDFFLGKNYDGSIHSLMTGDEREHRLLVRFYNNLPYLLKTKGTRTSIRALMNIYGIPESITRIKEFGGPKILTGKKRYFTFDDPTQVLNISGSEEIETAVYNSDLGRKPDVIELTFKTSELPSGSSSTVSGSYNLIRGIDGSDTYFTIYLDSIPDSDFNGKVRIGVSGSAGMSYATSSKIPVFDNDFYTLGVIRTRGGNDDTFNVYVKKSLYESFTHEVSASLFVSTSMYESASAVKIGNEFSGSINEFRLWKRSFTEDVFDRHVLYNESISGDNYTASVDDLLVRVPFEVPQNLGTNTTIKNYAYTGSNEYGVDFVTASNFASITTEPYHYTYLTVDSAVESPGIGYRWDTTKIRFESQSMVYSNELYLNNRATNKSFDDSPVDSNKLGIFFSPSEEINRDILRSLGGLDFMNEIGDPEYIYSSSYAGLDDINSYYWQRHGDGMNIHDYITLIRQFDNTFFDYLDDLKPNRTKLVKGLLFEPHLLERNRIALRKPSKDEVYYEAYSEYTSSLFQSASYLYYEASHSINDSEIFATGSYDSYTASASFSDINEVTGSYLTYTSSIELVDDTLIATASYNSYEASSSMVRSHLSESVSVVSAPVQDVIGFYENFSVPRSLSPLFTGSYFSPTYGEPQSAFGIFAQNGISEIIFTSAGNEQRVRYKLEIIDTHVSKSIQTLKEDSTLYEYTASLSSDVVKVLNILPVTASFTSGSDPVDGYLFPHRIYHSDLTTGLQNSFYDGCVQTQETTIDGKPPWEIFISTPGTLKVDKSGKDGTDPILYIE